MVKIQLELSTKADAIVSYEKALNNFKTKAEAINSLLEKLEENLR